MTLALEYLMQCGYDHGGSFVKRGTTEFFYALSSHTVGYGENLMSTSEKKDELVKITYEPLKEIVIKEYTRFEEIEDLVYIFAQLRAGGAPVSLDWANGVVFVYSALAPDTEQIMEEYLKGKVYWANVTFAAMPEYKPILETKEKIQVPIINLSSNPIIRQVTEWLKRQK